MTQRAAVALALLIAAGASAAQSAPARTTAQSAPAGTAAQSAPAGTAAQSVPADTAAQSVPADTAAQSVPADTAAQSVPAGTAAQSAPTDDAALRLASLAASCAQCHGTGGHPAPGSALPPLAGMPAAELAAHLRAFKGGARPGTVMPQIAKGYNDAQIDRLAAYFAAQGKDAR